MSEVGSLTSRYDVLVTDKVCYFVVSDNRLLLTPWMPSMVKVRTMWADEEAKKEKGEEVRPKKEAPKGLCIVFFSADCRPDVA